MSLLDQLRAYEQRRLSKISIPENTLAYRNNNPGNLRFAGQQGASQGEGGFARFESPEDGYAALKRQIELDAGRGHTLGSFVNKYAPPVENDTQGYVGFLENRLGTSADQPLSNLPIDRVAAAMAEMESGARSAQKTDLLAQLRRYEAANAPEQPNSTLAALGTGFDRMGSALHTSFDLFRGDEAGAQAAATKGAAIPSTPAQERFRASIQGNVEDPDSWWSNLVGIGKSVWQQPKGAWQEMVAQAPNSLPSMLAAATAWKAGAVAGTAVMPGVGTVVGGITGGIIGLVAGSVALETGFKAQEDVSAGKPFDADDIKTRGTKKGVFIGLTDAIMMGGAGLVGNTLFKPAIKAANKAQADFLLSKGINPLDDAAIKATPGLSSQLAAIGKAAAQPHLPSKKTIAGLLAAGTAGDMVSEGFGEYGGEMWAEGEADKTDATLEGIMSLGQGAVHTAIGGGVGRMVARQQSPADALTNKPNADAVDAANTDALDRVIAGDSLIKETTDTRERPFDPAAYQEAELEDWEMAVGPVDRPLTPAQLNDARMREIEAADEATEAQQGQWQARTVEVPETDQGAWGEQQGDLAEQVAMGRGMEAQRAEALKRQEIRFAQDALREYEGRRLKAGEKAKKTALESRITALQDELTEMVGPRDRVGQEAAKRQQQMDRDVQEKPAPPSSDEVYALKRMQAEVLNSQTRGVTQANTLGQNETVAFPATSPQWMRDLNAGMPKDKLFSRKEISGLIDKFVNGEKMTSKQFDRLQQIRDAAADYRKTEGDYVAQSDANEMAKKGYELYGGAEFTASELKPGDKFIGEVEGVKDEWVVGDTNSEGVLMKDGVSKRVVPFDTVKVDGLKKGETPASQADTAAKVDNNLEKVTDISGKVDKTWQVEGDTRKDEDGVTQIFRMIDPHLVGITEEDGPRIKADVESYAERMRKGEVPPPVEIVYNEPTQRPVSTNRRRVLAARKAGQKIPAWVDERADKALSQQPTPPTEVQAPSQKDTEQQTPGASADGVRQPWEMSAKEFTGQRDDATKKLERDVFYINGVEVIQNPLPSDTRQIKSEVRKEFPGNKDASIRFTEDAYGNRFIWAANKGIHSQIEPAIARRIGRDVNQNADSVFGRANHKKAIYDALVAGENVPDAIIAEYPGIMDYPGIPKRTPATKTQTKEDKIQAIDKFFAGDNKAGLQKKLNELKQNRDQFKDDPEFLKQIDDRIAEIEQQISAPAASDTSAPQGAAPAKPAPQEGGKGPVYQTAYHGTPHIWPPEPGFPHGRPRLDKIGTGEGAAAYGHGWYSADAPDVAQGYKEALSGYEKPWSLTQNAVMNPRTGTWEFLAYKDGMGGPQKAFDSKKEASAFVEAENKRIKEKGSVYKLDIPDSVIPKLLDWDAPMADQPNHIKDAAKKFPEFEYGPAHRGSDFYNFLARAKFDSKKAASEYLASIGIPGNRYLDGMSRGTANGKVQELRQMSTGDWVVKIQVDRGNGPMTTESVQPTKKEAEAWAERKINQGTYNYVIWDQSVLDQIAILERNGEKLDAIRAAYQTANTDTTPGQSTGQTPPQSGKMTGKETINGRTLAQKRVPLSDNKRVRPRISREAAERQFQRSFSFHDPSGKTRLVKSSTKTHRQLERIADTLGLQVFFFQSSHPQLSRAHGFTEKGTRVVFVNAKASDPLLPVVGHEFIHQLERNHRDLYDFLLNTLRVSDGNFEKYVSRLVMSRDGLDFGAIPAQEKEMLYEEFVGDFAFDQFHRTAFWKKLVDRNPSMTRRIINVLQSILNKIKSMYPRTEQFVSNLRESQDALVSVLNQVMERENLSPSGGNKTGRNRYTFAGPEAATADKSKAFEAQQMRDDGVSRTRVWKDTGWWEIVPNSDVWAFEIDDSKVKLNPILKDADGDLIAEGKLSDLMEAGDLFESYPWLKDMTAQISVNPDRAKESGSFRSPEMLKDYPGEPNIYVKAKTEEDARSILLHEIQHGVQEYEGFAGGGNQESVGRISRSEIESLEQERMRIQGLGRIQPGATVKPSASWGKYLAQHKRIQKQIKELRQKTKGVSAYDQYQQLTGEAQSRLTQRRIDMTPAQRKLIPPWKTLEKMMGEEGLLQEGQKPEDVLISRDSAGVAMSEGRAAKKGEVINIQSDLFRESGANASTDEAKIDQFYEDMMSDGSYSKFPPITGTLSEITLQDVEEYQEAEADGYEYELAYSRPLTEKDIGKQIVSIDDGHNRAYAAKAAGVDIRVKLLRDEKVASPEAMSESTDQEYLAAVERGDMETAGKMVEDAAKAAGYTVGPVYHGTFKGADFTEFKESKNGVVGRGVYVTPFDGDAMAYGEKVYPLYAKMENPMTVEYGDIPMGVDMRKRAEMLGHDGIIIQSKMRGEDFSEASVFSPEQIASADPVTRDNSGNVIPLSQRFTDSPDIRYTTTADRVPADAYERVKQQNKNLKNKAILSFSRIKNEAVKGIDKYMGSISTRLGNINPKLSAQIKTLDLKINMKTGDDSKLVIPLLKKAKKMTRDDYAVWDFALKNSDGNKLKELHSKYGMEAEYQTVRKMLDRIRQEAIDVGYDVGQIDEYWPRVLKDQQGFLEATERGSERPVFTDAINKRAKDMGMKPWEMSDEMKAEIISNVILGKYYGIPGPGAVKHRVFDVIPDEYNQFYMDSTASIINHIHSMRKRIEARKFFGKTPEYITAAKKNMRSAEARLRKAEDPDRIRDIKQDIAYYGAIVEKYKHQRDYTDNIDTYILDLMEKKEINPSQENEVWEVLNARFNEVGVRGLVQAYKNFSYIDTMGSFTSAITQIGDLAWSFYDNGVFPTLKVLPAAVRNRSRITRSDVGFDRIAQEFSDTDQLGKAVSWVFKMTGLEKVDGIGKETLMNGAYNKFKSMAKSNPEALKKQIRHIFENETDSVVQDLLHDDVTDNVRLLVAHKVLDFQPMALSEMPEKYLTGGNGRIFYMLKTFTIKSFDVFRREAYNKLRSKDTAERIQGLKNLTRLAFFFVLANAAADELKDLLLGRDTEPSDRLVDNILRLFGISKFVTWQARTEGVGTAVGKQIFPPFKFVDGVYKDVVTAGDDKGLKSLQSVPIVGKLMYWHMGRGSYNKQDLWETRFSKEKRRLNKVKERMERARNKGEFFRGNRQDLYALKRANKVQGQLNKIQKNINRLKSREQTKETKNRIKRLQDRRIEIIKRYMEK